ncbi:MAG: glycosyltransferase family 2 protein [Flavobacteriaceae bacterium]|nr:glycosyltransferase family 2 protein [Flavobacteriaceae bacterium]
MDLSIIIVTYNSEQYVIECLESIKTFCKLINYEIIVLDNNSKDRTTHIIESDYKNIKLIKSENNLGFSKGNNQAMKHSTGKYILLLNIDTILLQSVSEILDQFKKTKSIGALGIKMLNKDGRYLLSVGNFPNPWCLIKLSFLNIISTEFSTGQFINPNQLRKVDWVTGAFLLTKKEYWNTVNGLDEDYFMYVEDVDYCKKLEQISKYTYFLPSHNYIHFVGFNKNRESLLIKAYEIFINKHFKGLNKIIAKASLKINHVYKKAFKSFC